MSKQIVLICGSRGINQLNISRYIKNIDKIQKIVHGGCRGVDSIADPWAKANDIEAVVYKPNYKVYGRRAPLVRDEEMAEFCDVIICFWDGKSRGSKYTCDYGRKIGRKVIIHLIEEYD